MTAPLEGIRILDLSRALAGPYCTMILGDMGATIIKVEPPNGDETRGWGPPFMPNTQDSAYFAGLNRNKQSITLDLKLPDAKMILTQLIQQSDVLVQNFRVGTMEKLGFGYEDVSKIAPNIVYCSISGFGSTGPYAYKGGYDIIVQGMGGIMSVTGEPEGEPMRVGVPIVDITTGMFAVQGILASLLVREKTGKGQYIETSLLESQIGWLTNVASNYLISGKLPKRMGNQHPNITPYQPYTTADGHITLAVGNDKLWQAFVKIIGKLELAQDARFITNSLRNENRQQLNAILIPTFLQKKTQEWLNLLDSVDIPCGPIHTVDKVFQDPQVLERDMVLSVEHPSAGTIKMTGFPIKLFETPCKITSHPPLLGEHTDSILKKLGYSDESIFKFRRNGVI